MTKTLNQPSLYAYAALEQARTWFQSELGNELLQIEQRLLDQILPSCWGELALEVSPFATRFNYDRCPIQQHYRLNPLLPPQGSPPALVAEPIALPFYPESANLVILHHLLEFCPEPHRIVREAVQTLAPEGRILIFGFNPRSLWGMWRWAAAEHGSGPWSGNFLAASRMEDWLSLLHCQSEGALYDLFKPPFQSRPWFHHWRHLGQMARQQNWPIGAVYLMVARKRRAAMISQPATKRRLRLAAGGVPKLAMGQISRNEEHE